MNFWKPSRAASSVPEQASPDNPAAPVPPDREERERFHVFNESRTLIAAYLLSTIMELYPHETADARAERALEQSNALLAARRRARDRILRLRKEGQA